MLRTLRRNYNRIYGYTAPRLSPSTHFRIKTLNKISPEGLKLLPSDRYSVDDDDKRVHAILLRSHKIQADDVPHECRAIARCGTGTNNCNVPLMTKLGIPVFNTPGANANSVKELVLCGMLLASRRILQGSSHMKDLHEQGIASERVEKDKSMFGGREIKGKTLGVVGLGAIGSEVTNAAIALGMEVIGYDPALSVDAALALPGGQMSTTDDLPELMRAADYVTLHAPYIKDVTHHMIDAEMIGLLKPDASILNFARGELVNTQALRERYDSDPNFTGRYISDFPVDELWDHDNCVVIPHLGASTKEAEENAAAMAAETLRLFLENGIVRNSVNFPSVRLPMRDSTSARVVIVNKNISGMLSKIHNFFGDEGINIQQTMNSSRGDIAYNVVDLDRTDFPYEEGLQQRLTMIEGVISTRIISGEGDRHGVGFAVQREGEYLI